MSIADKGYEELKKQLSSSILDKGELLDYEGELSSVLNKYGMGSSGRFARQLGSFGASKTKAYTNALTSLMGNKMNFDFEEGMFDKREVAAEKQRKSEMKTALFNALGTAIGTIGGAYGGNMIKGISGLFGKKAKLLKSTIGGIRKSPSIGDIIGMNSGTLTDAAKIKGW